MTALIIVAAILAALALLLLIPIGVRVRATEQVNVTLRVLFFGFRLYPSKPKIPKEKKKKPKPDTSPEKHDKEHKNAKEKSRDPIGTVRFVTAFVRKIGKRFPKCFRLKLNRVVITVGGKDAAECAILWGAVRAGVAYLATALEAFLPTKTGAKSQLSVTPDFIGGKSTADIDIVLSSRVWKLLVFAFHSLRAYLKEKRGWNPDKIQEPKEN